MEASVAEFRAQQDEEKTAARRKQVKPLYDLVHSADFKKVRKELEAIPSDLEGDSELGAVVRSVKSLGRVMERIDQLPSLKKQEAS